MICTDKYTRCPKCRRKGWYLTNTGDPREGDVHKCKYCGHYEWPKSQ
jgi:hypothetical protein